MNLTKNIGIFLLIAFLAGVWNTAEAKDKKDTGAHAPFIMEKTPGKVYVFGVSQRLGGEEVFITEINEIDSLALQKKTNFLPFRSALSLQLQTYTEGKLEEPHQTVSIFFSTKKDKLKQTLSKVRKRYQANSGKEVTTIVLDDFKFKHPLDMNAVRTEGEENQNQNELKE